MRLACCAILLAGVSACTPDEIAMVQWIDSQPVGCHQAVDRYWPPSSAGWAHRVVNRESRGRPEAQNRRSSAAGCFQLMKVHAWRFDATGSSWSARYDPAANILAGLHLYREQGSRPWR